MQRAKENEKMEQTIQELWENFKRYNMFNENSRRREKGTEEIFEATMTENSPKLMMVTKPQMQETHQVG